MPTFASSFVVNAPLAVVRAFHGDTQALKQLTPPPVLVQLRNIQPLAEGSVSEFTMWLGPFPIPWRAEHRDVSDAGFTDVQAAGPAAKWEHTHRFVAVDTDRTEVQDRIQYQHYAGRRGLLTRCLFAKPNLWLMFTYRKWVTQRACARLAGQTRRRGNGVS